MFQKIEVGAGTVCDCQKAFGDYSAVGNKTGNDGIHTAVHFKFQWKFEVHASQQLSSLNGIVKNTFSTAVSAFLTPAFINGIFKPPCPFVSHITA